MKQSVLDTRSELFFSETRHCIAISFSSSSFVGEAMDDAEWTRKKEKIQTTQKSFWASDAAWKGKWRKRQQVIKSNDGASLVLLMCVQALEEVINTQIRKRN